MIRWMEKTGQLKSRRKKKKIAAASNSCHHSAIDFESSLWMPPRPLNIRNMIQPLVRLLVVSWISLVRLNRSWTCYPFVISYLCLVSTLRFATEFLFVAGFPLLTSSLRHRVVVLFLVRQQEFCQWETFNATCPKNDVILIVSAFYGRMKVGRCLTVDYHVGCHGDVTETVASRCSGRQTCSVTVPDPELFRLQPCRKDLVAYFEATYRCIHSRVKRYSMGI